MSLVQEGHLPESKVTLVCCVCCSLLITATDGCLFRPWTNPRPKPKSQQVHPAADKQQLVDCCEHEELVLEEFVALLDTAGNDAPQQQNQDGAARELPARPGTAPAAAFGSQQQQVRSPSATRIGSTSKNTDLDWSEFIDRQSRFISRKEAKVKAVTAYTYGKTASPEVRCSPRPILSQHFLFQTPPLCATLSVLRRTVR